MRGRVVLSTAQRLRSFIQCLGKAPAEAFGKSPVISSFLFVWFSKTKDLCAIQWPARHFELIGQPKPQLRGTDVPTSAHSQELCESQETGWEMNPSLYFWKHSRKDSSLTHSIQQQLANQEDVGW